jgi:guanylate kinase
MDIDVQGAEQIRYRLREGQEEDLLRDCFLDIFVTPPSMEALRTRLEGRGEDTAEVMEARLRNAEGEMEKAGEFQYTIINDDLDRAYTELEGIIHRHQHG